MVTMSSVIAFGFQQEPRVDSLLFVIRSVLNFDPCYN